MQIKELFAQSKRGPAHENEDALLTCDRFVAVIDGVTSKTEQPAAAQMSGGRFAAQTLCRLLETAPITTDPLQLLTYLNEGLKQAIAQSVFAACAEPPAASVVLYDRLAGYVVGYGDCQALIRGQAKKREKRLDRICAEKRAAVLEQYLRDGWTEEQLRENDPGRLAIVEDLLKSFARYANQTGEYGFPVMGTGKICREFVDVYPVEAGEELILASDGYPELRSTLEESEQVLQRVLREDPLLMRQYRSTKGLGKDCISYDDRTYVRFVAG